MLYTQVVDEISHEDKTVARCIKCGRKAWLGGPYTPDEKMVRETWPWCASGPGWMWCHYFDQYELTFEDDLTVVDKK